MASKYWCFTENNNAEEFYDSLADVFAAAEGKIKYIGGQLEQASTGQIHFQGYAQLDQSRQLSFVKNWISGTAHFEKQRGTNTQAREYCMKEDTQLRPYIDFGTFFVGRQSRGSGQGTRTDIIALRDHIVQGGTQRQAVENEDLVGTFAKYIKFADRVRMLYPPKKQEETPFKISLYYGAPGTGKTRKAYAENEDLFECPISNGTLWLDGYDMHKVVLFDDFMGRGTKLGLDNTLKFFDRYVRKVPVKGTHSWYAPEHIIVTSNYHPRAWYDWTNREESWGALKRRFHEVIVFEVSGEQVDMDPEEFFEDTDLWPTQNTETDNRTQDRYYPA